jgi:hypothetical protein
VIQALISFENSLKIGLAASLKIGIIYRKKGQNSLDELKSNSM